MRLFWIIWVSPEGNCRCLQRKKQREIIQRKEETAVQETDAEF